MDNLVVSPVPQNLDDLVLELLRLPLKEFTERAPKVIMDYLALGYGVCMIRHPESGDALEECFKHLCRRRAEEEESQS